LNLFFILFFNGILWFGPCGAILFDSRRRVAAEGAGGSNAEHGDPYQLAGVEQHIIQPLEIHLAVDEKGESARVGDRDAGELRRREQAEDLCHR